MLVGEWIGSCTRRPPSAVVGHTAKLVGQLLDEGFAPEDVRRGLAAWAAKGLHPSALPSVVNGLVNEVMNRSTDGSVVPLARASGWNGPYQNPPPAAYEEPCPWGNP